MTAEARLFSLAVAHCMAPRRNQIIPLLDLLGVREASLTSLIALWIVHKWGLLLTAASANLPLIWGLFLWGRSWNLLPSGESGLQSCSLNSALGRVWIWLGKTKCFLWQFFKLLLQLCLVVSPKALTWILFCLPFPCLKLGMISMIFWLIVQPQFKRYILSLLFIYLVNMSRRAGLYRQFQRSRIELLLTPILISLNFVLSSR